MMKSKQRKTACSTIKDDVKHGTAKMPMRHALVRN